MNKLLLCDDDLEYCAMLKEFLSLHNYQADCYLQPEIIMEKINQDQPDLVVLNYDYSKVSTMTGLSLVKDIRAKYAKEDLPLIIISANRDAEIMNQFWNLGVAGIILKPMESLEAFLLLVKKCLALNDR